MENKQMNKHASYFGFNQVMGLYTSRENLITGGTWNDKKEAGVSALDVILRQCDSDTLRDVKLTARNAECDEPYGC